MIVRVSPDGAEHAPVVGHEQQRAAVRVQRGLQLFDGRQIEMVRGLVKDQQVDPTRLQQRQRRPGPLSRRQCRGRP